MSRTPRSARPLAPMPLTMFRAPRVIDYALRPDMQIIVQDWRRRGLITFTIASKTSVIVTLTEAGLAEIEKAQR